MAKIPPFTNDRRAEAEKARKRNKVTKPTAQRKGTVERGEPVSGTLAPPSPELIARALRFYLNHRAKSRASMAKWRKRKAAKSP